MKKRRKNENALILEISVHLFFECIAVKFSLFI